MNVVSNIVFAVEKIDDAWAEAQELFVQHKKELGSWEQSELAVDYPLYKAAESSGHFLAFTVREDGKLIGYAAIWLRACAHYVNETWGHSDTIFVRSENRNEGLGDALVDFVESNLHDRGVKAVQWSVRADHPQGRALGMILTRRGAKRLSITYGTRFD